MQLRSVYDQMLAFDHEYSAICRQAAEELETRALFNKRRSLARNSVREFYCSLQYLQYCIYCSDVNFEIMSGLLLRRSAAAN